MTKKAFSNVSRIFLFLPAALLYGQDIRITQTPLEQLMEIRVTSVSKKEEPLQSAPASVYVLTQKQIEASGATTLPQALRLVPGVQVARVDASKWAIGIRGFGSRTTQNLLVLRDGRSLYSPLFAGTFWEIEDYVLEDVERIEVVRGPGGATWGANAVNGVINIITKSSKDTQGGSFAAGAGNEEEGFGYFRVGSKLDVHNSARVYGKYHKKDGGYQKPEAFDDWNVHQMGFRFDREKGPYTVNISGDYYEGEIGEKQDSNDSFTAGYEGGNLLAAASLKRSESVYSLKTYYDYRLLNHRSIDEERHTVDAELRHQKTLFKQHALNWGVEYRLTWDDIPVEVNTALPPEFRSEVRPRERTDHLYQLFLQDDFAVLPELHLILGTKVEYNDYTGPEYQPSFKVLYLPHPEHTLWASVSRAVRIPSRLESDIYLGDTTRLGENFQSESVIANEWGYRMVKERWHLHFSGFYNLYNNLRTSESGFFENKLDGITYGSEWVLNRQLSEKLNANLSYSNLFLEIDPQSGSTDSTREAEIEKGSPRHQAGLQLMYQLAKSWNINSFLRFIDEIENQGVDRYLELDLTLSYQTAPWLKLTLAGHNLLQAHHAEQIILTSSGVKKSSEVERSFHAKATACF